MVRQFLRLFEVLVLRVVPGLINLGVVGFLGHRLGAPLYGQYSTIVAGVGLASILAYGAFTHAVVSQFARFEREGRGEALRDSVVVLAILVTVGLASVGAVVAAGGLIGWSWIAPACALGAYTLVQELHHARMRFWSYGAASMAQSLALAGGAYLLVRSQPTVDAALNAFALSYIFGCLVSLALVRFTRPAGFSTKIALDLAKIGGPYTAGILAENGLFLGFRLLLAAFGQVHHLGVFSFCVDVAQRLVGFLVNIVTFTFAPQAFKNEDALTFRRVLRVGSIISVALAVPAIAVVLVASNTGAMPGLASAAFDPLIFIIVALAVLVNRLRRLAVDSFALRMGKAAWIALGYVVAAPVAIVVAIGSIWLRIPLGVEGAYLAGYVGAAAITAALVTRGIRMAQGAALPTKEHV